MQMSTLKRTWLYDWSRCFLVLLLIGLLLPSSSARAQGPSGSSRKDAAARRLNATRLSDKTIWGEELSSAELSTDLIQDGGFEAGYNNPYWWEYDSEFGTPLCDGEVCGYWSDAHPHSGNYWAWFGMAEAPNHTAYLEQSISFPSCGKAVLNFYFWIGYALPGSGADDVFYAKVDGNTVFRADATQTGAYSSYKLITIDLASYAAGAPHTIRFTHTNTYQDVGFHVDDVSLIWNSCPVISGTAGTAGASLSYVDGSPKNVIADGGGNYSFTVPFNWSGTVTPSKAGFTFSPTSRVYSNLTSHQPGQNYSASWVGGVSITADKKIVAVGRPHVGDEVASYDGFTEGGLTSYVPMLFNNAYGSYNSALYVQNVHTSLRANITVKYYDSEGNLKCAKNDTVDPLSSKGYWVPSETCLPDGWVGGAVVTSDQPIVAVGRPHVGNEVMTYNGFTGGSLVSYIPMLFNNTWGSYNSAFYIQNVHDTNTATISIKYYDNTGLLQCTKADTIKPLASKGYWVPSTTCDMGSLPDGWVGGVVVTSDQPIVGVGRPHVGTQVTTYNGFTSGSTNSYVPMLFNNAWGSYNSAFYLQNTHPSLTATITLKYYDSSGALTCSKTDTIEPLASKGYWVPSAICDFGALPAGWVGGVVVTSDQPIVGVGRPHIGTQVTTYNGFTAGNPNIYLPMLFSNAWGSYNSAFYVQNTESANASVTIKLYDTNGTLACTRIDTIPALSTKGYWVPSITCNP
jgi:hypothetical protein